MGGGAPPDSKKGSIPFWEGRVLYEGGKRREIKYATEELSRSRNAKRGRDLGGDEGGSGRGGKSRQEGKQ